MSTLTIWRCAAFTGNAVGQRSIWGRSFPATPTPPATCMASFTPSSGAKGPRDNTGGWHDAGDYGRYVVNSGVTTGTLLWTWEIYGKKIKGIRLKIPESGNGTPDILNEARWNLEWMLKMQDADGGVGTSRPASTSTALLRRRTTSCLAKLSGPAPAPYKSTCATADLAAVAAIAARVYKPYDAKFAAQALDAARRAWAWTEKNPDVTFRNPTGLHRRVWRRELQRRAALGGCGA